MKCRGWEDNSETCHGYNPTHDMNDVNKGDHNFSFRTVVWVLVRSFLFVYWNKDAHNVAIIRTEISISYQFFKDLGCCAGRGKTRGGDPYMLVGDARRHIQFTVRAGEAYPPPPKNTLCINEFIIRRLNPLVVVDFSFISAPLHT